jgi:hypothetical protein
MEFGALSTVVLLILLVAVAVRRLRRRRRDIGSGAAGTVYDMLNEDKRNALEIVVEGRAEARDPEHADGNLPELESPRS